MLSQKEQQLLDAIEKRNPGDVEIVTLELTGSHRAPTICVYIDTPGGVTFDEITQAQRWISDLMDELDPFPGAYTLEVSSPGIDRPLRTVKHFQDAVGSRVHLTTTRPVDGRSSWTGILKSADEASLVLDVDGETYTIPFDQVKRANIKGEVTFR